MYRPRWGLAVTLVVFVGTTAQLALATLAPDLPQFNGKAFGTRLVAYPVLMWLAPAIWWLVRGRRTPHPPAPWGAFALIMAPFLIDVTGNTLNLYDAVRWWDDANHFLNWALLLGGIGLLLDRRPRIAPAWVTGLAIAGLGAILAIAWEVSEWATFMRFGKELAFAYEDTLSDLTLGTLGGSLAAMAVVTRRGHHPRPRADDSSAV